MPTPLLLLWRAELDPQSVLLAAAQGRTRELCPHRSCLLSAICIRLARADTKTMAECPPQRAHRVAASTAADSLAKPRSCWPSSGP